MKMLMRTNLQFIKNKEILLLKHFLNLKLFKKNFKLYLRNK